MLDRAGGGYGMAIARRLIEMHGKLTVIAGPAERPLKGISYSNNSFEISLPRNPQRETAGPVEMMSAK